MLNIFWISVIVASLISCTSIIDSDMAQRKSVNASVTSIIKAFDHAAVGLRGKSTNGRELVSRYHTPGGNGVTLDPKNPKRAYAKLRILGERRPYTLQIQYIIEKRDESENYSTQSYDQEKAKKILKSLLDYLVTRPDREDFIDDFRPF